MYGDVLRELEQEGLLVNEEDRVYLTPRGTFLGNNVFERFCLKNSLKNICFYLNLNKKVQKYNKGLLKR